MDGFESDNGNDHRAGTEIIASISTRKSGFACIVLLSGVFEFAISSIYAANHKVVQVRQIVFFKQICNVPCTDDLFAWRRVYQFLNGYSCFIIEQVFLIYKDRFRKFDYDI